MSLREVARVFFSFGVLLASIGTPWVAHADERTLLVGPRGEPAALEALVVARGARVRAASRRVVIVDAPSAAMARELETSIASAGLARWVERDRALTPREVMPEDHPGPLALGGGDIVGTSGCPRLRELETIRAPEAWAIARGASAPVIAIEDSGFYAAHLDLAGRVLAQRDYGDRDDVAELYLGSGIPGHGTFIAGMLAAVDDNDVGRAGLAPEARLFLQKIVDASGNFFLSYAVEAMLDVASRAPAVRVLSYSLAAGYSASMEAAIADLGDAGVLVVTSAANCVSGPDCSDGDDDLFPVYPASFDAEHVIAVAGTTWDDAWNPWSHYGVRTVDLAAPGVDLCSLGIGAPDATDTESGTSYATPLVAAAAALIWEAHTRLDAVEVGRILRASARRLDVLATRVRSGGRLDAAAALTTGLVRLEAPPASIVVDGMASLALSIETPAAAGDVTIVLTHDDAIDVRVAAPWTAERVLAGQTIMLPDAGVARLPSGGTLLRRTLGAHAIETVRLTIFGRRPGASVMTVRAVITSSGASYLNAPWLEGSEDTTGFLAYTSALEVRAASEIDAGPIAADGGATDAMVASERDAGAALPRRDGCACGVGHRASPSGLLAALFAMFFWRRR